MPILKAKIDGAWVEVGAAGVPAGGATDAILSKSSAADYATAWTTTPTLAGATITGSASVGGALTVTGDASITGTLTSKHAVRAAGAIDGGTGGGISQFGFSAGSRSAVGVYALTLASALTHPIITATPVGAGSATIAATISGGTSITVYTFIGGVAANCDFTIHVVSL
jgi:hypothetical protein